MVFGRFEYVIMYFFWLGGYVCVKFLYFSGYFVYINLCFYVNIFNNFIECYFMLFFVCWFFISLFFDGDSVFCYV